MEEFCYNLENGKWFEKMKTKTKLKGVLLAILLVYALGACSTGFQIDDSSSTPTSEGSGGTGVENTGFTSGGGVSRSGNKVLIHYLGAPLSNEGVRGLESDLSLTN